MMIFSFIKKLIKNYDNQISHVKLVNMNDIQILPKDDKTTVTTDLVQIIYRVIEKYKILENLKGYKKYLIKVTDHIANGKNITQTYHIWKENIFDKIETPFHLPHQPNNVDCPSNIILVQLECINSYSSTMDSFWGFEGYVLLLLIRIKELDIWDARGEKAY